MKRLLASIAILPLLAACDQLPSLDMSDKTSAMEQQIAIGNAQSMRKNGNAEGAVALLRQQPENELTLAQLGYALIEANHYEEAVGTFDKLIAMQPKNADAYNGKAVAFDSAGNHFAAQSIYRKALTLSPDAVNVSNNLALSLVMSGQTDTAITMLEALHTKLPDDATIRQNLALAYGVKGDKKKALALNLKSMTPEQAKENLRFYEQYAKDRKKLEASANSKPAGAKTPEPKIAPAAGEAKQEATPETDAGGSFFDFSSWSIPTEVKAEYPKRIKGR